MTREDIAAALAKYVAEHPHNTITSAQAISPQDVGEHMYEAPIIAVGDAADPLWAE